METILNKKTVLESANSEYSKLMFTIYVSLISISFLVSLFVDFRLGFYWTEGALLTIFILLIFKLSTIFPFVKFKYLKKLLDYNESVKIDLYELLNVKNRVDWDQFTADDFFQKDTVSDPIEFDSKTLATEYLIYVTDFKKSQEALGVANISEAKKMVFGKTEADDNLYELAKMVIAERMIAHTEEQISEQIDKREALTKEIEGLLQIREYETTFQG